MSTREATQRPSAPLAGRRLAHLVPGLLVVVLAATAAGIGYGSASRLGTVAPVVVAGGLGLAALAYSRFELFVPTILLVRASLDAAKIGTSSVDATGAISVLFIAAGAVWLAAQREETPSVEPSPFVPPLAALVGAGAISLLYSRFPVEGAIELVRMATVVVILAVLNRLLTDRRRINLVLAAFLASSAVPALVGAWQLLSGRASYFPGGFVRVQGTFLHPNPYAAYLSMVIVLGAAVLPHVARRLRLPLLALLALDGVLLVATYSRGAWIATVLGLVIVGAAENKRLLAVVLIAMAVGVVAVPSIGGRFADLSTEMKPSGAAGNSLVWRFHYWGEVLSLQRDPVFGIGLRSVELSTDVEKAPHNDFVRVYVEMGIVGLLAYLWLLLVLVREARSAMARAAPGLARSLAVAFAAAVATFVLLSAVGNLISQLVILWYFGTIAATAVAASRLEPAGARTHPAGARR